MKTLISLLLACAVALSAAQSLSAIYNQRVRSVQKMQRPMSGIPAWIAKHEGVV